MPARSRPPGRRCPRSSTTCSRQFPSVRDQIVDADGNLNKFVNVYVSNEDVRLGDGLQTAVPDGSTVIVLPAMAGG